MKLTLFILSYLAGLSILAPMGWAATHEITTKNFHITLLGNGDGPADWMGTRDWSDAQIAAVTTTLNIWDDTFRNTASRKIEATISWGALGEGTLAASFSNYVGYDGENYNAATSTEVIWKEGEDVALDEGKWISGSNSTQSTASAQATPRPRTLRISSASSCMKSDTMSVSTR